MSRANLENLRSAESWFSCSDGHGRRNRSLILLPTALQSKKWQIWIQRGKWIFDRIFEIRHALITLFPNGLCYGTNLDVCLSEVFKVWTRNRTITT